MHRNMLNRLYAPHTIMILILSALWHFMCCYIWLFFQTNLDCIIVTGTSCLAVCSSTLYVQISYEMQNIKNLEIY
jgi:hypothetical protein